MKATFRCLWTLLAGVMLLGGCNVTEADRMNVATDEQELQGGGDMWVVARPDYRKCVSPLCGGYWIQMVNRRTTKELYVSGLDFALTELDAKNIEHVLAAGAHDVLLYGNRGAIDPEWGVRPFMVKEALRGLPGVTYDDFDQFFAVKLEPMECFAAPCPIGTVRKLNGGQETFIHATDAEGAAKPFVDQLWLRDQVERHGALVAGYLDSGQYFPAGFEVVLRFEQVFIPLPYQPAPCLHVGTLECERGEMATYYRTADRCVRPLSCVRAHGCPGEAPTCWPGYTRTSWVNAWGCRSFACDPTFTVR